MDSRITNDPVSIIKNLSDQKITLAITKIFTILELLKSVFDIDHPGLVSPLPHYHHYKHPGVNVSSIPCFLPESLRLRLCASQSSVKTIILIYFSYVAAVNCC